MGNQLQRIFQTAERTYLIKQKRQQELNNPPAKIFLYLSLYLKCSMCSMIVSRIEQDMSGMSNAISRWYKTSTLSKTQQRRGRRYCYGLKEHTTRNHNFFPFLMQCCAVTSTFYYFFPFTSSQGKNSFKARAMLGGQPAGGWVWSGAYP